MKTNIFLLIALISILFFSCSMPHYYYSSNIHDVPLFSVSNEFTGHLAVSSGEVNNCFELQAGYSLPGHVAFTANLMTGGKDDSSDDYEDFSKITYFEGTGGYYTTFSDIAVFELYGGYGGGSQRHAFSYGEYDGWLYWLRVPDGNAELSFSKFFIQPDIGIRIENLEGAISCRLSRLNFRNIEFNGVNYHLDELSSLELYNNPWLIEPAFTFRGGFKSVKGQIQVAFSGNLSNPELKFEKLRFSIGLHFRLGKKKSGK